MKCKVIVFSLSALLTVGVLQRPMSDAFEVKTHEALSLRSVDAAVPGASSLDGYLWQVLRFEFFDGIAQRFQRKEVREWIQFGSNKEDSPDQRVQQHFHDPTKPWNQAGLSTGGISSVIWSQTQNQDNGVGATTEPGDLIIASYYAPYLVYRGPLGQELDAVVAGGHCGSGGGGGDF